MKFIKIFGLAFGLLAFSFATAQSSSAEQICINPKFNKKVNQLISYSVPITSPKELSKVKETVMLLDTRELDEYSISHIEGALYAGYDHFNIDQYLTLPRDTSIVLYCSVGYRSEKIGELFLKAGFTNVQNLYGSIFEWVNQGMPVVNAKGLKTDKVHTYDKSWSKWVMDGKAEKTW